MIVTRENLYDIILNQKFRYAVIEDMQGNRVAKFSDGSQGVNPTELLSNIKDWIEHYGNDFQFTFKQSPTAKDDVFYYTLRRSDGAPALNAPSPVNIDEIEKRITDKIRMETRIKDLEEKEEKFANIAGQIEYIVTILINKLVNPQQMAGAMQGVQMETEKDVSMEDKEKIEKAFELLVNTPGLTPDLLLQIATKLNSKPNLINTIKNFL